MNVLSACDCVSFGIRELLKTNPVRIRIFAANANYPCLPRRYDVLTVIILLNKLEDSVETRSRISQPGNSDGCTVPFAVTTSPS